MCTNIEYILYYIASMYIVCLYSSGPFSACNVVVWSERWAKQNWMIFCFAFKTRVAFTYLNPAFWYGCQILNFLYGYVIPNVILFRACIKNADAVCSIEVSSESQNLWVQKVMFQRSTDLYTHCTHANAFPAVINWPVL